MTNKKLNIRFDLDLSTPETVGSLLKKFSTEEKRSNTASILYIIGGFLKSHYMIKDQR